MRGAVDPVTGAVRRTGKLDGLHVRLKADGELRVTGSLTKYAYGDNIRNLTIAGVRQAVQDLAAALQLDATTARIFRVDVGCTLAMPRPPAVYLKRLISCPRTRRAEYEQETVVFLAGKARKTGQARRVLSFYDKGRQAGVEGKNLLRFEVQFRRRVKEQLGLKLTLADLCNPDTFARLVRRWQEEFAGVRMARRPGALEPTRKTRELTLQLAMIGLASMGVQDARRQLAVWRECEQVSDRQFFRLKRRVNELATGGAPEEGQEVIEELNAAIERAGRRALDTEARTFQG